MAVTLEWVEKMRADLKAQETHHVGMLNQLAGAVKILDEVKAELTKPEAEKPAVE